MRRILSIAFVLVFAASLLTAPPAGAEERGETPQIAAGAYHAVALKSDGTLWAWGNNSLGQMGDGTTVNKSTPTKIGTDNKWISVAAGSVHTIALKSDGTLWAWGRNDAGQLGIGIGNTGPQICNGGITGVGACSTSPIQIGTDNKWASIAAGEAHTIALKADGTLWAWGRNNVGQLGIGNNTGPQTCVGGTNGPGSACSTSPVQIGTDNKWVSVVAGYDYTIALKSDGTLWAWGHNGLGNLGDGTTVNKSSPAQIGTDNNWVSISAGAYHTLSLKSDGTLWAWGGNSHGQLGDGTTVHKLIPTQIGTDNKWVSISVGAYHTLSLKSDGTLWAWGYNSSGQLGDGTTVSKTTPTQIGPDNKWVSIAAGAWHTEALKSDGTLWAWGGNDQIGNGTTVNSLTPIEIMQAGTGSAWGEIGVGGSHTVALKSDGTLWAWGSNNYGQLGDSTTIDKHSPVQVGADSNWVSVAAGEDYTIALRSDGTLWAWGSNSGGRLGDGTPIDKHSPVQIDADSNWVSVAAGGLHALALKSDGTLWAWGSNGFSQLGDSTTTQRYSPVRIGADSNWVAVAAGYVHTIALKSDGTLWAWGNNDQGQLGDGTTTQRNSPLRIGIDSNWVSIAAGHLHTIALKSDGSLWAWGENSEGQLGDGTTTRRTSPVRIGTDSNWVSVTGGRYAYTVALKSDGTLWAWGNNGNGQLGDGTWTGKYSPVQIGTDSNWVSVIAGLAYTIALKSDGTLWAWGSNYSGALGDCTTTASTFPVQITGSCPDTSQPTTTVSPAGGIYNITQSVTLTCSDGTGSGCDKTYYCLGVGCNPSTLYSGSISISYSTDLRFYSMDLAANSEAVKTETYTISAADTTPPSGSVSINAGAALTNSTSATLTLTCSDASGCAEMQFSSDNTNWSLPEAHATTRAWTLAPGDGNNAVFVKFKDFAGNWTGTYPASQAHIPPNTIMLDTTAPTGSIVIDSGAAFANAVSVVLSLSASDKNGISEMQFSNDGATWSAPEAYATAKSWTLASGNGAKTVYMKFKDQAGNWSNLYSDDITLDSAAPVIVTATLAHGTAGVSYNQGLSAAGGVAPYTWSLLSGTLPPGLSLDSNTGIVAGTPTVSGGYSFTVQVTDANSVSNVKELSAVIKSSGDKLYVVRETAEGAKEIAEFLPDGTFVKSYGSSDMANVDGRAHMAISGNSLFVAEKGGLGSRVLQFDSSGTFVRAITPDSSATPGVSSITADFANQSFYFIDYWGGNNVVRHIDDVSTGQSSPLGAVAYQEMHDMVTDPASAVMFVLGYGSPFIVDNTAGDRHYDRVYMVDALGNVAGTFDSSVFDVGFIFDAGSLAVHPLTGNLFAVTMSPGSIAPDYGEPGGAYDTIIEFERGTGLVVNSITPQPGAYIDQIAFDSGGDLYVNYYNSDAALHDVYVYGTDGSLLRTIPAGGKVYDVLVSPVIPDTHTYTISATAGTGGNITQSGDLTVPAGGNAHFDINPETGYQVLSVIVDGANKGAVGSYTFTDVQANHTINAYFKAVSYTITATAEANGAINSPGVNTVSLGSSMSFTITPNAGYHIADVLIDGVSAGAGATYPFTDIQANHTIAATFAANTSYTIDAIAGANGSITPSGAVSALGGTNGQFSMNAASGYRVADLQVDGSSVGALTSYTFYDVQTAHNINVTFTLDVYTITATVTNYDSSTPGNGSITVNGNAPPATVSAGAGITYTITPNADYVVYSVLVDGAQQGAITSYTFTNVQANHTIAAYVRPVTYAVTASPGIGGVITPIGTSTFDIHTSPIYTIMANAGYHVTDVLVDGISQGAAGSYTFTDITANHTISATFEANGGITITASVSSGNGSITPAGDVSVSAGANQKFTFAPQSGSRVADVVVDGVSMGALTSYTFNSVQAPSHTISVSFVPDVYSISVMAATGGSVTVSGSSIPTTTVNGGESSTITVNPGESVTITITADPGRSVRSLVDNGAYRYNITTYSLTNIRANHTINVYFR